MVDTHPTPDSYRNSSSWNIEVDADKVVNSGKRAPTKTKLTDKFIQSIKPTDKRMTYWDTVEPGLGIVVQPSGYRSFVVIRRIRGGKPVKYVIRPEYPTMTLALARAKAVEVKRDLAAGVNTREQERQADAERERFKAEQVRISFASVAEDYIKRKIVGANPDNPLLRTADMLEKAIRRDVLIQPWAKKPVTAVTRDEVKQMIFDFAKDRDRKRRNGDWSQVAFRSFNFVRQILKWALTKDYGLDINVCDKIDINEEIGASKPPARERVLDDVELKVFWKAAAQIGYPGGLMLQGLLLTGLRLREFAHLELAEITRLDGANFSGPVLVIGAERMKGRANKSIEHVVPVTGALQSILDQVPKFACPEFVFSYTGGQTPMGSFGLLKTKIDLTMRRELSSLEQWQFHDLRRTARSLMSRIGVNPDISERVLAHALPGMRRVYDRFEYTPQKLAALEALAAEVKRIVE
jgi:integrase